MTGWSEWFCPYVGLFRDLIPDQAVGPGGALVMMRQRNGCIPDLRVGLQVKLDPRPSDYHPLAGRRPAPPRQASLTPSRTVSSLPRSWPQQEKRIGTQQSFK